MKKYSFKAIAAALVATIVVSISLTSCEGRKMSNMQPTGETVEVIIERPEAEPQEGVASRIVDAAADEEGTTQPGSGQDNSLP